MVVRIKKCPEALHKKIALLADYLDLPLLFLITFIKEHCYFNSVHHTSFDWEESSEYLGVSQEKLDNWSRMLVSDQHSIKQKIMNSPFSIDKYGIVSIEDIIKEVLEYKHIYDLFGEYDGESSNYGSSSDSEVSVISDSSEESS